MPEIDAVTAAEPAATHRALYNKYRPRTFAEVRGQEHATDALRNALSSGGIHHAYLFSGPRGCGKTSSARILAASLNCESGPTAEPCGTCEQCVGIRLGNSLDVIEIDAASHGGVDDTRDLRERAFFAATSARHKIYIIDEAHMITTQAFNALLKIVEEPPPHVKFIFATTEPDKVIQTIRSRTFHYHFRLVPPKVLIDHLGQICAQEGVTVDPAVLPLVVRAGGGSVRDSLSILDQLIAGAGSDGLGYEAAAAMLGLTDAVLLDTAVEALATRDAGAMFALVDRVVSSGHDPKRFGHDLLDHLRDLLVLAAAEDAVDRGLLASVPADQAMTMQQQAKRLGLPEISRAADILHAGLVEMRGTANPKLLLELVFARVLIPNATADAAALAVRLDRLERRLEVSGGGGSTPTSSAPSSGSAAPAAPMSGDPRALALAAAQAAAPASPPAQTAPAQPAPAQTPPAQTPPAQTAPAQTAPAQTAPAQAAPTDRPTSASAEAPGQAASPASRPSPVSAEAPPPAPGPPATAPAPAPAAAWPETARAGGDTAPVPAAPTPVAPVLAGAPSGPAPHQPAAQSAPSAPSGSEVPSAAAAAAVPAAAPAPGSTAVDLQRLRALWPQLLDAVKSRSRVTHALLSQHGQIAAATDKELTLAFGLAPIARQFESAANVEIFSEALQQVAGLSPRVLVTSGQPAPQPSAPAAAPAAFDPSDEPDPDDDPVEESGGMRGEDAAVALLQDGLGAKVIGEVQP